VSGSGGPPLGGRDGSVDVDAVELDLLLEAIHRRYGHDFRSYARASLLRRLSQALARLGCANLSELQGRVLREPALFARLLPMLTVQVSTLFRDPAYFIALRTQVLPVLATYPSLKVWVAGCSTGEEAYSLAILLHEEGLLDRTIVYATDINMESLAFAERGVFPIDRIPDFSADYRRAGGRRSLSDYYTAAYEGAVFDKRLRRRIVFTDHSLAIDNVFAETHLVSCRNVLIYFDRPLQDRALGLFTESLVRRGFLGLGPSESLRHTAYADAYEVVARAERIYRKR